MQKEVDEEGESIIGLTESKGSQAVECYNQAELVRKELFAGPLAVANASIAKLDQRLQTLKSVKTIKSEKDLQTEHTARRGGILSQDVIGQTNELLKIMNEKWVSGSLLKQS
jgi:hypothetical protein